MHAFVDSSREAGLRGPLRSRPLLLQLAACGPPAVLPASLSGRVGFFLDRGPVETWKTRGVFALVTLMDNARWSCLLVGSTSVTALRGHCDCPLAAAFPFSLVAQAASCQIRISQLFSLRSGAGHRLLKSLLTRDGPSSPVVAMLRRSFHHATSFAVCDLGKSMSIASRWIPTG